MEKHKVVVFRLYPFDIGQKIHIEQGPRKGDWEVVAVTDRKVRLRCPLSLKEYEWDRFCYHAGEAYFEHWPAKE